MIRNLLCQYRRAGAAVATAFSAPALMQMATLSRNTTMSRIFISGSSAGLGLMAGELLVQQGHQVVLHARNAARAEDARLALPAAEAVVEGDLDTIAGAKAVAARVNQLGRFDAVIHNAAVGYRESHVLTPDGLP